MRLYQPSQNSTIDYNIPLVLMNLKKLRKDTAVFQLGWEKGRVQKKLGTI